MAAASSLLLLLLPLPPLRGCHEENANLLPTRLHSSPYFPPAILGEARKKFISLIDFKSSSDL